MITREDRITQSVQDYGRAELVERGYGETEVRWLEAFPYQGVETPLTVNYIASGFNFDDEGRPAELGSDLTTRLYTCEFFVFGMTNTYARNLAHALKFALDRDEAIPLKDIAVAGAPVIDYLEVLGASSERQIVPDPEPFQEFIWTTTLQVEDTYSASLV